MPRKIYEERLAYNREYRRSHPEKMREFDKRKYLKERFLDIELFRKKSREKMKKWRYNNYEYAFGKAKLYRQSHPDVFAKARRKHYWKYKMRDREKTNARQKIVNRTPLGKYIVLKRHAKCYGHAFDISKEAYFEMIKAPCFYCGVSIEGSAGHSLDRKDNALGYLSRNVVVCCKLCNRIKSSILTSEEMLVAMRAVKELRIQKALSGTNMETKI